MGVPRVESLSFPNSQQRLSRRELLRRAGLYAGVPTAMLLAAHAADSYIPPNIPTVDQDQYHHGYERIASEKDSFYQALSQPQEQKPLGFSTFASRSSNEIVQIEYESNGSEPLILNIRHKPSHHVQAKVVLGEVDDLQLFQPVMESIRPTNNEIYLPELPPGHHKLTLFSPDSSPPTTAEQIDELILMSQTGNTLQNTLATNAPFFFIRPNNLTHLTQDMPWFEWVSPFTDGQNLLLPYSLGLNYEIGGDSAEKRFKTYGRLTDMQLAYQTKILDALGKNPQIGAKVIEQWTLFGGGHGWTEFTGQSLNEHSQIQIKTNNNTFASKPETSLLYTPVPFIQQPGGRQFDMLLERPEILLTSLYACRIRGGDGLPHAFLASLEQQYMELLYAVQNQEYPHS